jgi:hypothetical protein
MNAMFLSRAAERCVVESWSTEPGRSPVPFIGEMHMLNRCLYRIRSRF